MSENKIDPQLIQNYLHAHIPISRAMGISVVEAKPHLLKLKAPLDANINHRDSVFGGSAAAVAILSAWSLVHSKLMAEQIEARLVIQKNSMRYLKPIMGDFTAICKIDDEQQWNRFFHVFQRKGMARIRLTAHLACEDEIVADFDGDYVAVLRSKTVA